MGGKNIHEDHRERLRERYIKEGVDGMEPHTVLELMLFYIFGRQDTNPLAHELIDTFGSFSGVLEAPVEDLAAVKGMGNKSAVFLKLFLDVYRVYLTDKKSNVKKLSTVAEIGDWLMPRFIGRRNEIVMLLCMDSKNEVISTNILFEGSVNAATFSVKALVSTALRVNAAGIVLAHNHPGGLALPSKKDVVTTLRIKFVLESIGLTLIDHLIFAEGDFVSLAQSNLLNRLNVFDTFLQENESVGRAADGD